MAPPVVRRLLRWLNKAATRPELFSDDERITIVKLVMEIARWNDPRTFLAAARVVVRMVGHDQRLDHREGWARLRAKSVK